MVLLSYQYATLRDTSQVTHGLFQFTDVRMTHRGWPGRTSCRLKPQYAEISTFQQLPSWVRSSHASCNQGGGGGVGREPSMGFVFQV